LRAIIAQAIRAILLVKAIAAILVDLRYQLDNIARYEHMANHDGHISVQGGLFDKNSFQFIGQNDFCIHDLEFTR